MCFTRVGPLNLPEKYQIVTSNSVKYQNKNSKYFVPKRVINSHMGWKMLWNSQDKMTTSNINHQYDLNINCQKYTKHVLKHVL